MDQNDDIERFIRDHREDFEQQEPAADVWEKLERSLYAPKEETPAGRPVVRRLFTGSKRWLTAAAAVVLCVSLAAFARTYQLKTQMMDTAIPQDLRDAQAYYENRISLKVARIKSISARQGGDSTLWQAFTHRDEEYDRLKKALSENPGEPHVRAAFVEFYRSRLQVLTRIEGQLEERSGQPGASR